MIIFKASEVISFMQGSLLLLGAYLMARFHDTLGFWGALAVGIGGSGDSLPWSSSGSSSTGCAVRRSSASRS